MQRLIGEVLKEESDEKPSYGVVILASSLLLFEAVVTYDFNETKGL